MEKKNNSLLLSFELILTLILFCVFIPSVSALKNGDTASYGYTGTIQEFEAPATGYYQLEVWGAQGGTAQSSYTGGYGGYSTGVVFLDKKEKIYIVVGGAGTNGVSNTKNGGYNGGGSSQSVFNGAYHASGGGATHIAKSSGLLSTFSSKRSNLLIVAGGGGGSWYQTSGFTILQRGGNAGGYIGGTVGGTINTTYKTFSTGGTQSQGGKQGNFNASTNVISGAFGQGGHRNGDCGSGGGGGYYGGGGAVCTAGGGGSGYIGNSELLTHTYNGKTIRKSMYCYSCSTSTTASTYTVSTTNVSGSAVANYAKTGHGAAKITLMEMTNTDARLKEVTISGTRFHETFNPDTKTYQYAIDADNTSVTIAAKPMDTLTTVTGTGKYDLKVGETTVTLTGTADSGDVAVYTLKLVRPASNYPYLESIKVDGKEISNFEPTKLTYNLEVPYQTTTLNLDVLKGRTGQTVTYNSDLSLHSGMNTVEILVVSEDGRNQAVYTLNVLRAHSSKLKSLTISGNSYNPVLKPSFNPETLEYEIDVMASTLTLNVNAVPYDEEAKVKLEGFGYIKGNTTAKITVTEPNSTETIYTIKIHKENSVEPTAYDYPYRGYIETFTAPATGFYQLETWGAQGGTAQGSYPGGYGAYSTGVVFLEKDEKVYIAVGGAGTNGVSNTRAGGFNGGGSSQSVYGGAYHASGGGATHMAKSTGLLTTFNSDTKKSDLLIVAGGGGGSWYQVSGYTIVQSGGHGGGYIGGSVGGTINTTYKTYSTGGTQSQGGKKGSYISSINIISGSFGQGGHRDGTCGSGGGGGYYGGGGAICTAAGGGSGYIASSDLKSYKNITKSMYCYGCSTTNNTDTLTIKTSNVNSSPISKYAKTGNGHARITLLPNPSENFYLDELHVKIDGVEQNYTPEFKYDTDEYLLELTDPKMTSADITAITADINATVSGDGIVTIKAGTNKFPIEVTAESGAKKVYNLTITRPASEDALAKNITVNGLIPSLCAMHSSFCNLEPATFNSETKEYTLTVPSKIKQLTFIVDKNHPFQTVKGDGVVPLRDGLNDIVIEITSESGDVTEEYHYKVTRINSDNADISMIEVTNPATDIHFDPGITEYHLSVPNEYTSLGLEITLSDATSSYQVKGNENFKVGTNQVLITVTSVSGNTKLYILNVYREKNKNIYLSDLKVEDGTTEYPVTPEFNKINFGSYQVTVPNSVTSVTIVATPEEALTKVSGAGLKNLNTGTNHYPILMTAEDGTTETYDLYITRERNSNPNLSDITVSTGEEINSLTPSFNPDITEYTVNVKEGTNLVNITATPEVSTTTYRLLDNTTIRIGDNIKRILAIAEDGTTKTYTVNIIRNASSDNYLKDIQLSVGTLNPAFQKETTVYEIEVESNVSSINIEGIKNNVFQTVYGNGSYSLIKGENNIELYVTSEDGQMRTYSLTVIRHQNNNAFLKDIETSVGTLNPEFNKETLEYHIAVPNEVQKIKLTGIPEAPTTTVGGNNEYNLQTGPNRFTFTAIAEDKTTTKVYEVIVDKAPSDNANLKHLLMEEGALDPEFKSDRKEYHINVPNNVTKGTFHIETEEEHATYEITGNNDFQVGDNTVTIEVTSESGKKEQYTLTITRQEDFTGSDYLADLSIVETSLDPAFNKELQYYELRVPNNLTKVTLNATPEDPLASVTGTGEYELLPGKNILNVKVTSTDNKTRDYQIVIIRESSDDATLSKLEIEDSLLSPNFQSNVTNYKVTTTEKSLNFLQVVPTQTDATYEIIGNNFTENKDYQVIIRVTAPNKITRKEYILDVTKQPSDNNNLASLTVDGFTISPEFNKGTTIYYVTIPENQNTVLIEAIPEHEKASVSGTGIQTTLVGENHYIIEVTSESGKKKAYTIILTKEGNNNNRILDLKVNNGIMAQKFNPELLDYDVTVSGTEDALDLTIILDNDKSTYHVLNNKLEFGLNEVSVIVTSESGMTETYSLHVTKENVVSALLEQLKVKNYEFTREFNSYVNDYYVLVDNETTSLDLTIVPIDKNATYEVTGNESLIVGNNTITIEVTASDLVTKETYRIHATRQEYANTFLDYLYTSEGDITPKFNKTTMEYTIEVANHVEQIEIFGEAEDKSTTVTGLGTYNLVSGENKVDITVTSKSGIKRVYHITVNRLKNTDNDLTSLIVKNGTTIFPLDPNFQKDTLEYTVNVPEDTEFVTIEGELSNNKSFVTGLGMHSLDKAKYDANIMVTSEAGELKTYVVHIIREETNNNHLIEIIPSVGTLSPEFSYEGTEYEITVDESASHLSFEVVKENDKSSVTGIESQIIPDGTSKRVITVTAENGEVREYTITVIKERSDNALLSHLEVKGYPFTETFDPTTFEYHITVPNNKKILFQSDIIATAEDPNASIKMSENLNLVTTSNNEFIITVTAKDGFTKQTYKIIVTREKGSNALLNSLEFKKGKLETVFQPETFTYNWVIPSTTTVTKEDILPTPQDENATIEIREEENKFIIKVTSEDGSDFKEYTLNITLDDNFDLESITPSETSILLDINETKQITYTLTPEITSFKEVKWISEDENIATVDTNGNITGVGYGTTTVHVVSTYDETVKGSIEVTVIRKKIMSNVYDIKRYTEDEKTTILDAEDYIIGIEPKTTVIDYKNNLENDNQYLHVYNLDNEELDDDTIIGNGFIVRLIYEDQELDKLTIIVRGDLNSDGYVNVNDYNRLNSRLLKIIEFNFYQRIAADLNNDTYVNVNDYNRLNSYLLKILPSLNKK